MNDGTLKLVYLLGAGRSGTTVLATILNSHEQIVSRGELNQLPELVSRRGRCSCGDRFADCDVWREVSEMQEIERLEHLSWMERHLRIPEWLLASGRRKAGAYLEAQREVLERLSAAVDRRWLLDSSKYIARALLLRWVPGIDIRYIYLVRDARGVVHSFGKKVQTPRGGVSASIYYTLINFAAELARRTALRGKVLHVRYEDLVTHPARELARIGAFLGEDLSEVAERIARGEVVPVGHIAGGNRLKSEASIALRADQQWQENMPRWRQWFYYVLCFPLQILNGYRP